ncbi:PREDICTED: trichohyalin-like [Polistes dominula]|uniref:Meiosis-specific nuclear structural protein 1 n=1 Tax=Polistes dominula TaxID=743375 RepID=A0ABM1J134_POLDO|nr:PREDICTED: trichohyalin-like [Polistes dominula]
MDWENGRVVGGRRRNIGSMLRNRESTDEITKLEEELKRAYCRKELVAQLAAKKSQEDMERAKAHLESEKNRLLASIELDDEDRRRIIKRDEAREEMVREIAERRAREAEEKTRLMEEGLRERRHLEEVDRKLEEYENLKKLKKKLQLTSDMIKDRKMSSDLFDIQMAYKKEEEEKLERDRRIYLQEIERRAKEAQNRRVELEKRRERVLTSLLTTILEEDASEREKKRLLQELVFEELELDRVIRDWQDRDIKNRMTKALANSLKEQIKLTELCKANFLRRNQQFAEEMSKKLAEDDKITRLNADAKKRALFKYRQDLEKMIIERQRIIEEEISKIEQEIQEEHILEACRQELIKKERSSLLLEHAANVAEYLDTSLLTEYEQDILHNISLSSMNETTKEKNDDNSKIRNVSNLPEEDYSVVENINKLHFHES